MWCHSTDYRSDSKRRYNKHLSSLNVTCRTAWRHSQCYNIRFKGFVTAHLPKQMARIIYIAIVTILTRTRFCLLMTCTLYLYISAKCVGPPRWLLENDLMQHVTSSPIKSSWVLYWLECFVVRRTQWTSLFSVPTGCDVIAIIMYARCRKQFAALS